MQSEADGMNFAVFIYDMHRTIRWYENGTSIEDLDELRAEQKRLKSFKWFNSRFGGSPAGPATGMKYECIYR